MKAQLAARTTGTVKTSGATPTATATEPNTGRKVEVVATLLVTSVKNIINAATAITKIINGTVLRLTRLCPIHSPSPVSLICTPRERPPPKRSNRPQGSLLDCSQASNSPFLPLDGIINKAIVHPV